MAVEMLYGCHLVRDDRPEAKDMTKNLKGLMHALQQSINEAIMESHNVAAALAALKRTGKCPVFTIDISLQDPTDEAAEPIDEYAEPAVDPFVARPPSSVAEELVLSDSDVEFLTTLGITDPSWCNISRSGTA
jgi:hypothetical protein